MGFITPLVPFAERWILKYASAPDDKREMVEAFLEKYGLIGGKRLSKEMRDKLLMKLNELLRIDRKKL